MFTIEAETTFVIWSSKCSVSSGETWEAAAESFLHFSDKFTDDKQSEFESLDFTNLRIWTESQQRILSVELGYEREQLQELVKTEHVRVQ